MSHDKREGRLKKGQENGSKAIQYDDVREANKKKSEYGSVVTPYYREEAAATIKSALKRYRAVKKAKKEHTEAGDNLPAKKTARQHYWAAKGQHLKRMNRLKEPEGIIENDAFNTQLVQAIKNDQYHLIDFKDKDFTPRLFAALRLGLITMNQMLSVKLMYESLFYSNKGKMPENPSGQFSRYKMDDSSGPYQPSKAISHWGKAETEQLEGELQKPGADKAYHYYTIDLPRHQAVVFFYYNIYFGNIGTQFIDMFTTYINRFDPKIIQASNILDLLKAYRNNPDKESKEKLQRFILEREPKLKNFLMGFYDSVNPNNEQNLGLTPAEYNREFASTLFLTTLYSVHSEMPSVCTARAAPGGIEQPLLSFVLPTIDTLNMLQKIAHGEEATLPAAVLGQETPRMIRAYDELPASKKSGRTLTPSEELLQSLYPTAGSLEGASRPIELTYPGIAKTDKPHGADCYDFLLSWHDVFHAWRNGSNYKELIRHFRKLHDEKSGFFEGVDAMSVNIWTLTDMDFSIGKFFRGKTDKASINRIAFTYILERSGYDFAAPKDDNYLFIYSLCQAPDNWGQPFGINPKMLGQAQDDTGDRFAQLNNEVIKMKQYLEDHPNASVVEVILHDLLKPVKGSDSLLLAKLNEFDLKKVFYWSANTGLFFKKEFRPELKKLAVTPNLRKNSPEHIRAALKAIAISKKLVDDKDLDEAEIKSEIANYNWPAVNILFDLCPQLTQLFEVDKTKQPQVIVLKITRKPISEFEKDPGKLLNVLFAHLDDKTLNKVLTVYHKDFPYGCHDLYIGLQEELSRVDKKNVEIMLGNLGNNKQAIEIFEFFPPEKHQNKELAPIILSMNRDRLNVFVYIKKYFELNPDKSKSLSEPQKKIIFGLVKELFRSHPDFIALGEGRKDIVNKDVYIKTKEEMRKAIDDRQRGVSYLMPYETNDPRIKYQFLSEQYQAFFDKILYNDPVTWGYRDALYTRKSEVDPLHSNDQTKSLTDTQLMHLGFLKSLFIADVKKLIRETHSNKGLIQHIDNSIKEKDHFINFNRTRYSWFVKETTASKEELQKELQAGFKSKFAALRGDGDEADLTTRSQNKIHK